MPEYTTIDEVKGFVGTLEERQTITKAAASKSEKTTLFSFIEGKRSGSRCSGYLKNHGARVYVDLGDDRLPEPPSVETAQVLRGTISQMRRFVLLVSPNSKGSIWIPWELGLADAQKSTAAVALFPVVQKVSETKWAEQEYLGLYRRIVWGPLQGHDKNVWMVYDHHTNTADHLTKWLRGY